MGSIRHWRAAALAACIGTASVGSATTATGDGKVGAPRVVVSIAEDSGGEIVRYMLRAAQIRQSQAQLRFEGRCDSACTLFLSLPAEQVCVTPAALFRFHLPIADSPAIVEEARDILMMTYPDWVVSWIAAHDGLTQDLMVMDYAYASRFIKPCDRPIKAAKVS